MAGSDVSSVDRRAELPPTKRRCDICTLFKCDVRTFRGIEAEHPSYCFGGECCDDCAVKLERGGWEIDR